MVINPIEIDRLALNGALLKIAVVLVVIYAVIHLISRVYLRDKYLKEQLKKSDKETKDKSEQDKD